MAGPALAGRRTLLGVGLALVIGLACTQAAISSKGRSLSEFASGHGPAPAAAPRTLGPMPTLVKRQAAHPVPGPTYLTVRATRGVRLRTSPRGRSAAVLGSRTEFGGPRILSVARRRGHWLGVVTSARPNGKLGWLDMRRPGIRLRRIHTSLHVDVSRRLLEVRRGGRVVARLRVGVGSVAAPTPAGRFAVTDKLNGRAISPAYGCCIVAFSGYQPHLPAGWRGGNRLAAHGAPRGGVGGATSAGCLRASDSDLRVLMRRVPVGAPVFVSR
jgi:L,D-transpeptidase catalytic domain